MNSYRRLKLRIMIYGGVIANLLLPLSANSLTPESYSGGASLAFTKGSSELTELHKQVLRDHVTRIRAFNLLFVILSASGDEPEPEISGTSQIYLAVARAMNIRKFLKEAGVEDHKILIALKPVRNGGDGPPMLAHKRGNVVVEYAGENCQPGRIAICRTDP